MLTDTEKAALVEELAEAIWGNDEGGYSYYDAAEMPQYRRMATACLPIIERLLAECDLDAALDRPDVAEQLGRQYARERNGEWDYDNRPSYKSHCDGNAVAEVESAIAIIQAAVKAAKEATS